jgi:Zn-finger protein
MPGQNKYFKLGHSCFLPLYSTNQSINVVLPTNLIKKYPWQLIKCHLMHKEQQKTTFIPNISSMILAQVLQCRNTINKDEYQNSCLLRCDLVLLGKWFPTFSSNVLSSSSVSAGPRIILLELTDAFRMKALWSFKMPGTTYPATMFHILKDPNP